jgi:uncharacterized membrane protein YphA (DoxX/SURF4 family)
VAGGWARNAAGAAGSIGKEALEEALDGSAAIVGRSEWADTGQGASKPPRSSSPAMIDTDRRRTDVTVSRQSPALKDGSACSRTAPALIEPVAPVYKLKRMNPRARVLVALTVLALAGLALVGSVSPAAAHTRTVPPVVEPAQSVAAVAVAPPAAEPPTAATIWLAVVLVVLLGLAVAAPRRTLVVALALVLVVLALEAGVHSVHHLSDRQAGSHCAVASASVHVQGAEQPVAPDAVWIPTPLGAMTAPDVDRPGSRPLRPDEGRAPPAA